MKANIKQNGYVKVVYPPDLRNAVVRAIASWKVFCALPAEVKRGLPYSNGSTGVGYELKDGIGQNADRKENFDLTMKGMQWLAKNAVRFKDDDAFKFIADASVIFAQMKSTIMEFARLAEVECSLPGFAEEVNASEAGFFVRFIHYFGDRNVGDETASAHVDQSGFTLHLFESHPGFQCLVAKPDRFWTDWEDVAITDGETVILPCMQFQLRSEGRIKATPHRVVATVETAGKLEGSASGLEEGRYSAVCFVQLKNTAKYDKDKGGRLQEKPPGFNFTMPHGEFKKLFKN